MGHPLITVIADDLTGAIEVGAHFAARSLPAVVTTECSFAARSSRARSSSVVVFDTESRHLPAAEARARVAALGGACREYGIQRIYKKTDSTLRGNIGAELGALVFGAHERLFYVPAYPQLGRTARDGNLYVNDAPLHLTAFANDPLEPISDSTIARLFDGHVSLPVVTLKRKEVPSNPDPAIYVFDGESDEDVAAAARYIVGQSCWIAAGPGGLAREIAMLLGCGEQPRGAFDAQRCMVINGSLHPVSRGQMAAGREAGWLEADFEEASAMLSSQSWILCRSEEPRGETTREYADQRAALLCDHLSESPVDCLVIFGGDTAYAIVKAMGVREIEPLFELAPGIPVSRMAWQPSGSGDTRHITLVTKAGGFGSRDALLAIRDLLQGSHFPSPVGEVGS